MPRPTTLNPFPSIIPTQNASLEHSRRKTISRSTSIYLPSRRNNDNQHHLLRKKKTTITPEARRNKTSGRVPFPPVILLFMIPQHSTDAGACGAASPYTAEHPYFIIQQNLAPNLPMATLTATNAGERKKDQQTTTTISWGKRGRRRSRVKPL